MQATLLLAVFVLTLTLRALYIRLHNARTARALACQPSPSYPADVIGISSFKEAAQAAREFALPRLFQTRLARISAREHRLVESYTIRQLGRTVLFTCDPKNIQALIATQFRDFGLGTVRQVTLEPLLGKGIFTTDGQEWAHSRALLRPQFTRDQISDLDLEERHVQTALRAITPIDPQTGWSAPVNIQTIFFRLTMDSATEFLFGESVDSQAAALDPSRTSTDAEFATLFDKGQAYAAQRTRLEIFHWLADTKESRAATAFVRGYVDRFVRAALREGSGSGSDLETKGDGEAGEREKQGYVFLKGLARATQDPVELRSQLLNILLAGRDTTASLLSWAVMMLARYPRIFAKLRAVVVESFGPYSPGAGAGTENITFASLKACRYLQHFLNEVLRLYPIVPVNRRMALKDTSLPRGGGPDGTHPVYVPKGQRVFYSVFVMQRRRDLWGNDAEEFVPERWETRKPGWEYLPFNGGPRICIGQQFALTEAGYVLVRLLQRFDAIEGVSVGTKPGDVEETEIGLQNHLTMAPAEQVTVRLREAST